MFNRVEQGKRKFLRDYCVNLKALPVNWGFKRRRFFFFCFWKAFQNFCHLLQKAWRHWQTFFHPSQDFLSNIFLFPSISNKAFSYFSRNLILFSMKTFTRQSKSRNTFPGNWGKMLKIVEGKIYIQLFTLCKDILEAFRSFFVCLQQANMFAHFFCCFLVASISFQWSSIYYAPIHW